MAIYRRRRSFRRRPRKSRRRFSRKGKVPRIRSRLTVRRSKRVRKYNKGALSLQARIQSAASLPQQTYARWYWKASGAISFNQHATSNGFASEGTSSIDQVFNLNDIHFPYEQFALSEVGQSQNLLNAQFAYKPLWATLYNEALCLGSKFRISIKRPYYPSNLANVVPNAAVYINQAAGATALRETTLPANAMHGFWYLRVRYFRSHGSTNPDPGDVVGHPMTDQINIYSDADLWANMRDFTQDPTVHWKRDHLPKVVGLSQTVATQNYTDQQAAGATVGVIAAASTMVARASGVRQEGRPAFGIDGSGATGIPRAESTMVYATPQTSTTYNLQFSSKPVTFTHAFSYRKHFVDSNPLRNAVWQDLNIGVPLGNDDRYRVRVGYIAFDANGLLSYHVPLDQHYIRQCDVDIQYFCALRSPRISPWETSLPAIAARLETFEDEEELFDDESEDELEPSDPKVLLHE